jgi:amino-acid N-acetyltransferase
VEHQTLPDKMFKDCQYCPRFNNGCDEVAMVYGGAGALEAAAAASQSQPALTVLQSTSSPR